MRVIVLLSLLCATWPGLAGAEIILKRPASCEPVLTVQKRGCEVENIFRCGAVPDGFFRSEEFSADGFDGVTHSTLGHDMIFYAEYDGSFSVAAIPEQTSSTPVAEMLATGRGQAEMNAVLTVFGISKPVRFTANVVLVDADFRVGDVDLARIETEIIFLMPQPMTPITGSDTMYFHGPTGTLFSGETQSSLDREEKIANAPAEVILPGQPGFGSSQPGYDCGEFSMGPLVPETGEPA